MSDDAAVGAHQDARTSRSLHRALDLSRQVILIDLTGGKRWLGSWCGPMYQPVLIRTRDGRWFCGRYTLDGYETPPGCPRGVRFLELTVEQALCWCTDQEAAPPSELIEEYESSIARTNGSQADRGVEASSPPTAEADPRPQATPQPGARPIDKEPVYPSGSRRGQKEPKPWEQKAYELWKTGKYTQKDVAEMLSGESGLTLDQPRVSRAVAKVAKWRGEPKPGPDSTGKKPRVLSVDPLKLGHIVQDTGRTLSQQSPSPLKERVSRRRGREE
jgi:hypothetical protein